VTPPPVRILVLEHDPTDPLLRLRDWLVEAGAVLTVLRPYAGDAVPTVSEIPTDAHDFDALISLGGEMGAHDDEVAPWLPATRRLLAAAVAKGTPTLGICLGAQLLAAATGGRVERGADGPEIGAYLTAKRDAAHDDPLFDELPMTPDVMHYHRDVISVLPPRAVLLLSAMGYPHQAFRVGAAAWGLQFHIEPTAEHVRKWARAAGVPVTARLGPMLDDADETMGFVWQEFAHRFVAFAADRAAADRTATDRTAAGPAARGVRLPIVTSET
jgi:GMP synthase-like glutamine amidotransferase